MVRLSREKPQIDLSKGGGRGSSIDLSKGGGRGSSIDLSKGRNMGPNAHVNQTRGRPPGASIDLNKGRGRSTSIDLNKRPTPTPQPARYQHPKTHLGVPGVGITLNHFPEGSQMNLRPTNGDPNSQFWEGSPANAYDCENWPESLACGGLPFRPGLLGMEFGIVEDECNSGFSFDKITVLGFNFGRREIVHRKPECRGGELPPPPEDFPDDIPDSEPPEIDEDDLPPGGTFCDLCGVFGKTSGGISYLSAVRSQNVISFPEGRSGSLYMSVRRPFCLNGGLFVYWKTKYKTFHYAQRKKFLDGSVSQGFHRFRLQSESWLRKHYPPVVDLSSNDASRGIKSTFVTVNVIKTEDCTWETPPTPPIPPTPKPNPDDPMTCCENTQRLLKLTLIELQRQNMALGVDDFVVPGTTAFQPKENLPYAPERLVEIRKTGHKGRVPLSNLMDVLEFQIRQVDRAVGALPFRAKVADADPTQEGNQSVEVEIQTLADGLRENLETTIESASDTDLTNLLVIRALFELGYIHQGSVQSWYMLDAICDYLDFKNHEKQVKVPFAFDPRAGRKQKKGFGQQDDEQNIPDDEQELEKILPKLLKETDVPIKVREWHKSEKKSLNDLVQEILRHAINAAAGVTEKATPERLEELVKEAQAKIQLASLLNKSDVQQALTSGKLRRGKG